MKKKIEHEKIAAEDSDDQTPVKTDGAIVPVAPKKKASGAK